MSVTCTITKAGRFDEYGRPLTVSQSYTGTYDFVKGLVRTGYASVTNDATFEDDYTPDVPAPSTVTGSRSLTKNDCLLPLRCDSASAIVLTIENDNTAGYGGTEAHVAYQAGAGAVSFTAGTGVTLRGTAPTAAQYASQGVMRVGSNEWAYL